MKQYTDTILMIEPVAFRYNEQTAVNNYYQKVMDELDTDKVQEQALHEFRTMVDKLEKRGIRVISVKDTLDPDTPDSIFPNNWVSFHEDKKVALYPMFAENRRQERRMDILEMLRLEGYGIEFLVDFSDNEDEKKYLEGTGSIVLDRVNRLAYAALSLRTHEELFKEFCQELDYRPVMFTANQDVNGERMPIYHTNVMMCIADTFAVVCLDCIDDMEERHRLIDAMEESNKEIIEISEDQKHHFAGNMLQVGKGDQRFLVMSSAAFQSLDESQIDAIQEHCPIIHSSLDTIEACGGGSARCMMAEVFLPRTEQ
jgi:hypothetical protein